MGQRSEGSDQAVADAVKAADAYMLGNSMIFGICGKQVTNILITTPLCRDDFEREEGCRWPSATEEAGSEHGWRWRP